jgi:hypothetical protein
MLSPTWTDEVVDPIVAFLDLHMNIYGPVESAEYLAMPKDEVSASTPSTCVLISTGEPPRLFHDPCLKFVLPTTNEPLQILRAAVSSETIPYLLIIVVVPAPVITGALTLIP